MKTLEQEIESSILPRDGLEDGVLDALEERCRLAEQAATREQQFESALEGAKVREAAAWQHIKNAINPERAADIDVEKIRALATFGREAEKYRARRSANAALIALLDDNSRGENTEDKKHAAKLLQRWVRQVQERESEAPPYVRTLVLIAAAAITVVAFVLALVWNPLGLLLIVLAGARAFAGYKMQGANSTMTTQDVQTEYSRLNVAEPEVWDVPSVERGLDELYHEIAEGELAKERSRKRREIEKTESNLNKEAETLQAEREALAEALGLDPDHEDEELIYLVERVAQWQTARVEVKDLDAKIEAEEGALDKELTALHNRISSYGFDRPGDVAEAKKHVSKLKQARDDLKDLKRDLKAADETLNQAQESINSLTMKIEDLFAGLQLDVDDDAGLYDLCSKLDRYRVLEQDRSGASAVEKEYRRKIEGHDLYDDDVLDLTDDELGAHLNHARERAAQAEDLQKQINEIEFNINQAEHGHELENARAEYEEALRALDDDRMSNFRALAGKLVADFVHEKTKDQKLPPVFKRARELFAEVTAHRYELGFDGDAFFAYDTVGERGLQLDQLSSGTRVQLLLSVRIAFLEEQEEGIRLPLDLDETLANSFDGKARAIIDAILRIAQSDRQVFYFTCQDDEVAKWHRVVKEWDGGRYEFHPLTGAVSVDEITRRAVPSDELFRKLPEPDGRSYDEFGHVLEVEHWHAYRPLGSLHLWYLLADCEVLYRLLKAGIERWGQLRHLDGMATVGAVGLSEAVHDRLCVYVRAIEAWRDAWMVGRGRRVDRTVLEDSGAVTSKFVKEVAELCSRLGGDGTALVAALRDGQLKGFYTSKMDELETYLIEGGFVDPADPLSEADIWSRTLAAVADDLSRVDADIEDVRRVLRRIRSAPAVKATI